MSKIHIQVIMPNDKKLDDIVSRAILPGIEGDFEVLEGHTAFITKLRPGILKVYKGEVAEYFALHDGFVTVEEDKITVLSENCECKKDINLERASAAKIRAEKRIADTGNTGIDFRRAEIALKRAITRIDTVNH
ncbi:MAG: ATP synthase F1 subunit epsilon [Candidatus Cloacimonetes bacterium]|nr:ATP synthase F1 subunit epsilon [Candidatus Cloacimonadota bacterium]